MDLEIFFNRHGLRVYFGKLQGLFSKRSRLKRYIHISAVGSYSSGLDLINPQSNPGRCFPIGQPALKERGSAASSRRRLSSRGGAARGSLAFGVSGVPGLKTERAWVGEDLHVMCDPPVAFAGLGAA